jgi:phosphate transport system substrate-binding protein
MVRGCVTGRGFWFPAVIAAVLFLGTAVHAETFTVPGTGACESIVAELAEAFNRATPGDSVAIPPSTGSGGGIDAVRKGEAALARVARPLKDAEVKEGLVQILFARDVVAFVVGRQVKIKNLSASQLAAIFSGKFTDWKEVGGPAGPIRVVAREAGDSSLTVIQKHLEAFRNLAFSPQAKVLLYDRITVETLDRHRNSIGFATLSMMQWSNGGITPVSLDGVTPTRENVLAGRYPIEEPYSFVYRKELTPAAGRFVAFVFSPAGRRIIENRGLIAVDRR